MVKFSFGYNIMQCLAEPFHQKAVKSKEEENRAKCSKVDCRCLLSHHWNDTTVLYQALRTPTPSPHSTQLFFIDVVPPLLKPPLWDIIGISHSLLQRYKLLPTSVAIMCTLERDRRNKKDGENTR